MTPWNSMLIHTKRNPFLGYKAIHHIYKHDPCFEVNPKPLGKVTRISLPLHSFFFSHSILSLLIMFIQMFIKHHIHWHSRDKGALSNFSVIILWSFFRMLVLWLMWMTLMVHSRSVPNAEVGSREIYKFFNVFLANPLRAWIWRLGTMVCKQLFGFVPVNGSVPPFLFPHESRPKTPPFTTYHTFALPVAKENKASMKYEAHIGEPKYVLMLKPCISTWKCCKKMAFAMISICLTVILILGNITVSNTRQHKTRQMRMAVTYPCGDISPSIDVELFSSASSVSMPGWLRYPPGWICTATAPSPSGVSIFSSLGGFGRLVPSWLATCASAIWTASWTAMVGSGLTVLIFAIVVVGEPISWPPWYWGKWRSWWLLKCANKRLSN